MDLKTLCEAQGLSGREEPVRRMILEACTARFGADAVALDGVGSVIVTVLTPADAVEVRAMTELAMRIPGPVYLRTVRCDVPKWSRTAAVAAWKA